MNRRALWVESSSHMLLITWFYLCETQSSSSHIILYSDFRQFQNLIHGGFASMISSIGIWCSALWWLSSLSVTRSFIFTWEDVGWHSSLYNPCPVAFADPCSVFSLSPCSITQFSRGSRCNICPVLASFSTICIWLLLHSHSPSFTRVDHLSLY